MPPRKSAPDKGKEKAVTPVEGGPDSQDPESHDQGFPDLPGLPGLTNTPLQVNPFNSSFPDPGEDVPNEEGDQSQASTISADSTLPAISTQETTASRSLHKQSTRTMKDLGATITATPKRKPANRKRTNATSKAKPAPLTTTGYDAEPVTSLTSASAATDNSAEEVMVKVAGLQDRMSALEAASNQYSHDAGKFSTQLDLFTKLLQPLQGKRIATEGALQKVAAAHFDTRTAVVELQNKVSDITSSMPSLDPLQDAVHGIENRLDQMEADWYEALDRVLQLPSLRSDDVRAAPDSPSHHHREPSSDEDDTHSVIGKRKRGPLPDPTAEVNEVGRYRSHRDPVEADVLFGPIKPGHLPTRAKDIIDRCNLDINNFVAVREDKERPHFIVIRLRSEDFARELVKRVRQRRNGPFRYVEDVRLLAATVPSSSMRSTRMMIASWNINGHLALKITDACVVNIIKSMSICFFQETYLAPQQETTLSLPPGYHIIAKSRPYRRGARLPGGGVAAVIKDDVTYSVCDAISCPDLLVLDLHSFYIICGYLLPASSKWVEWTAVDPETKLAEAIAYCREENSCKPILLMGDLNARTASRQPNHSPLLCTPLDEKSDRRGNWFLGLCDDYELHILNGTDIDSTIKADRDGWTSFQPLGRSVIDYAVTSTDMLQFVEEMEILEIQDAITDHAAVKVVLACDEGDGMGNADQTNGHLTMQDVIASIDHPNTVLEDALLATLNSALQDEEACLRLYGPVFYTENPASFYVSATSNSAVRNIAALAVYWRDNHFITRRVSGSRNKALIVAVIMGLLQTSPNRPVIIYTESEYLIRSLVYSAGRYALHGWNCANAEVMRIACMVLQRRSATTTFRILRERDEDQNVSWGNAQNLAQAALDNVGLQLSPDPNLTDIPEWSYPADRDPIDAAEMGITKVSANIPGHNNCSPATTVGSQAYDIANILPPRDMDRSSECHRGRSAARRTMWMNLHKLMDVCQTSAKDFWRFIRARSDRRQRTMPVTLEDLRMTFETRMNPPSTLPPEFNGAKFLADEQFLQSLPSSTVDETPQGFFSRPFSIEEVDEVKLKIMDRLRSATGIDGVNYSKMMEIPSENLADLFNLCIATGDAPKAWLTTLLIGILKPGRPAKDPDSYRLIALESCLLKMLTLLIARRFREWLDTTGILPEAQNGFRAGLRTINCALILRMAIDHCLANGQSLFALFIDLENAFPSTNLPTLWKKLAEAGAKGPLMDWMRMLYARMRYTVASQGKDREFTETFRSWWGILAGDSLSPDLFTFFASDCVPPESPHDICLDEIAVTCIFLADDIVFMEALSEDGMKDKLWYMAGDWCPHNFLKMSVVKTKAMIIGPLPRKLPDLHVNGKPIQFVDCFKYVGMYFQSTHRFIFAEHYKQKAKDALRNVFASIVWVESTTGDLWPIAMLRVFMARVDPHLVHGCEVAVDIHAPSFKLIDDVHLFALRRILQVSNNSVRAPLYTETGVMPLLHRRMILRLRCVQYLLQLSPERLAAVAFRDSKQLFRDGKPCWLADIKYELEHLPVPVPMQIEDVESVERVAELIESVQNSCAEWLHAEIEHNERTPLLKGRLRPGQRPVLRDIVKLRPYLTEVIVPSHRRALTRLIFSEHGLAVEQLRRRDRRRLVVPREARLCRFCLQDVEDEPHALLFCTQCPASIAEKRATLLENAKQLAPKIDWTGSHGDRYEILRSFLRIPKLLPSFAGFVYNVLKIYDETVMYVPPGYYVPDGCSNT